MNLQAKTLIGYIDPTLRQQEFIRAWQKYRFVLFGGAAGPGKSYMLRWSLVLFLYQLFVTRKIERACAALFCEDYPSLHDRQISKIEREFPPWLGRLRRGDTKEFVLTPEYGSGVLMLRNLDDPSKYLSTEFAAVGVDELTRDDLQTFNDLRLRLRWPGVERPIFLGATNPGGIGHAWVKKYWIDKEYPSELTHAKLPDGRTLDLSPEFAFVKALPTDNAHLTAQYWADLATLPEHMRRAYLDGNWDILAGQYFDIFQRGRHVFETSQLGLKDWHRRWISIDWGYAHSAATYWHSREGKVTKTYREYVTKQTGPRELAQHIVELSCLDNGTREKIAAIYLSPDAFHKRTDESTIAEQMTEVFRASELPPCARAADDRVGGWMRMYEGLKYDEWIISSGCKELINVLPSLTRNEDKREDCIKFDGDDAADAARYGVYSDAPAIGDPYPVRIQTAVSEMQKIVPATVNGVTDYNIVAMQSRIAEMKERVKLQPVKRNPRSRFGPPRHLVESYR